MRTVYQSSIWWRHSVTLCNSVANTVNRGQRLTDYAALSILHVSMMTSSSDIMQMSYMINCDPRLMDNFTLNIRVLILMTSLMSIRVFNLWNMRQVLLNTVFFCILLFVRSMYPERLCSASFIYARAYLMGFNIEKLHLSYYIITSRCTNGSNSFIWDYFIPAYNLMNS